MPYVNLQITTGATREQKAQLVKEITNSLVNVLGKKPEHVYSHSKDGGRRLGLFGVVN